jgi:hypothetical protein
MTSTPRTIELARSGVFFAALLALALAAFWPSYLSKIFDTSNPYIHLHAVTASMWVLMLIVQPLAIGARRFTMHRILGRASHVLAPLLVVIVVLLAHSRINEPDGRPYALQTYILYLQLSLALLFGVSYALAIRARRMVALHARFMVCTGLTMIDPVFARILFFWWDSTPTWNYQWFTFGLTDLVLVALIWLERKRTTGRAVFPAMLAFFVLLQAPALLGLTQSAAWQAFARWFAALPLT